MTWKRRADTMRALVRGSAIGGTASCTVILEELNGVYHATKLHDQKRKHLLQVLHGCRALDGTLKELIFVMKIPHGGHTMGSYLKSLAAATKISHKEQHEYYNKIVKLRNRYMHEAGAFPKSEADVTMLLSNIEASLARLSALR